MGGLILFLLIYQKQLNNFRSNYIKKRSKRK